MTEPFGPTLTPPNGPTLSLTTLMEQVLAEQRQRWDSERLPVEAYLKQHPQLARDEEAVLHLVFNEVVLREQAGDKPTLQDYQARFPHLSEQLAIQFEVDGAIRDDLADSDVTANQESLSWPGAPAEPRQPTSPPGFELVKELGRGGMGVVYQAWQTGLSRMVALKMLLSGDHAGEEDRRRFRQEAEAAARLKHPNIVQVHEIGEQEGRPYFALEYVDGGTLHKKLAGTPQPPAEAAALSETLARSVHHAHRMGVVHRDLKPANVLLTEDGTPKIADFGLAKMLIGGQADQTRTGAILGTPSYMAPEQARGQAREVGPAADVYALGAMLYEMLTGRPPFKGPSVVETVQQVVEREPVPPRRLQPGVPRDLETVCLKCLEKDPARRYPSAEQLADDLRRFQNGEPTLARPVGLAERALKFCRRRKLAAALLAVSALALVSAVAGGFFYVRSQGQRLHILQQEKEDRARLKAREEEALAKFAAGQAAFGRNELEDAQAALVSARDLLAGEHSLKALQERVNDLLKETQGGLREGQEAGKRRQAFEAHYNDALFQATLFTGLDVAESLAKARAAAEAALAVYRGDGKTAAADLSLLKADQPHLAGREYARLTAACSDMELVLVGPASRAGPGVLLVVPPSGGGTPQPPEGGTTNKKSAPQARWGLPAGPVEPFRVGLQQYWAGQFEDAASSFAAVVREVEGHFWAQYLLAICHQRTSRWGESKAELTVCIDRRPQFVWSRLLRGFAASELGPKQPSAKLAALEFEAAENDFNEALKQDRDPLVQYAGLVNRGVLNMRRGRWPEAVRDLRQAVQVQPEMYQAYVDLGRALKEQKKVDEALTALNEAIRRRPDLAALYESRAEMHLLLKHWRPARLDFQEAIQKHPKGGRLDRLANSLVQLGRLLNRERNYQAALASYDRALALVPDFVLAERYRAETLLKLDRHAEAAQALDRYLSATREPKAEAYEARGLLYADADLVPEAIEMYTLALRQHHKDGETEKDPEVRCYRGWAYLRSDAVRLGLDDFDACLRQEPANAEARIGRGNARVRVRLQETDTQARLRLLDGALADAVAAQKEDSLTDPRLLYHLARLYATAAGQLEAEARATGAALDRRADPRLAWCKDRALNCLLQALENLPQERRAGFWRSQVLSDPAFTVLRGEGLYSRLEARYAGGS